LLNSSLLLPPPPTDTFILEHYHSWAEADETVSVTATSNTPLSSYALGWSIGG
jgi:hypothetical protein